MDAMQQAKMIQDSLIKLGRINQRKPDFSPPDLNEVFQVGERDNPNAGGLARLANVGPDDDARCCITCRQELRRLSLPAFGDKGGPVIRPLPVCKCAIKKQEDEQKEAERKERRARLMKHYSQNLISPAIVNARFENWIERNGTDKAHAAALEFARDFENRTLGLLLTGDVGNGKSHLARAAQYDIDSRGWVTLFLDWPQLIEIAKNTFTSNKSSVYDIVRGAIDCDLLVMDEIGIDHLTSWEFKELLFPILNGRQGKKTIITTNCSMEELRLWFAADKDGNPLDDKGRLYDRIIGAYQLVKNNGTSKRREDAEKRRLGQ